MTNYRSLSTQKKGLAALLLSSSVCAGWLIAGAIDQWAMQHDQDPHQNTVVESVALHKGGCQ